MQNTNPAGLGSSERLAALKVMTGALMISFSGVYVKLAHVSPTVSGFYRVFLGGLMLLIIVLLRRERLWKDFSHFALTVICGFVFAADLFVWHRSVCYTGPGLATILGNFQVFLLALFGVAVLGEKISLSLILAIPLAMTGLFMIVGIDWNLMGENYKAGIFFGFATAVCYCGYILILRKIQSVKDGLSAMATLTVVSLSAAAFLGIEGWLEKNSFVIPDMQSLFSLFAYGIFSQVIGWILITKGLPQIRASLAGLLLLIQPSFAFIWDMLFFDRQATPMSITGAILALTAIYMGTARRADKKLTNQKNA
jgi:drug/metabolite transporter (DMT)-like permease